MTLAWIALRNLARNRRRTLLSLLVVAAGSVGILLTAGFITFSFQGLAEAIVRGGLGHFEIVRRSALGGSADRLDRPIEHGLEDWQRLRRRVEALPEVAAATANVHLLGMATAGQATASFVGLGVEPERQRAMGFTTRLRAGESLPPVPPLIGEEVVLLASGLADTLGVGPGDWVTLMAVTPHGMLNALDARVVGTYTTGLQDLDTRFLQVPLATAQRLLETPLVADLVVTLEKGVPLERGAAALERLAAGHDPPLAVVGWRQRAPYYRQVRDLYRGIFWFLGSVVFVLVVLSTSNTLLMAVMERLRELGTLRAIGTGRAQLAAIVLCEALWLGVLGGALGCLLGLLATWGINALQLQMPPPPGAVDPIDLRLALLPQAFAGTVLLMTAVLAVAAIVPVARAVRLRIVEALGHV
ncbi:MAG TPA: FtsX-like permease family protein [Thermoanaerobaculia bacterium]|nr:FtsX-like permease family protein [Thermoanaerobaculia bacterium]